MEYHSDNLLINMVFTHVKISESKSRLGSDN